MDESKNKNNGLNEYSLDPADWESTEELGRKMLRDMMKYFRELKDRPAWQPVPEGVINKFNEPLPSEGSGEEEVYEEFLKYILPYPNGNIHPRFWGWVQGPGFPYAMLADMLASGMNPHMAGFNQAPALVEEQVTGWMKELMGFPEEAGGILVSGGTMANITALTAARNSIEGYDIRKDGLQGSGAPKLVIYGSTETHRWAETAAELLGLGGDSFRKITVDAEYKINTAELKESIRSDREKGFTPLCVIGNAGTVNTGAVDHLKVISKICGEEKVWFHIDGAFGALARLSKKYSHLVEGIELADSIAFDLHKWMYFPFELGCCLIKDGEKHKNAFSKTASYIAGTERGVIAGGLQFAERGLELTRGFKALKVWMALKAYGLKKFSLLIEQNIEQAKFLESIISKNKNLELLAPVELNIVCFRFKAEGLTDKQLNEINNEILLRIQESGTAVPSGTVLENRFAIRAAIVNHRSRREDFELLAKAVYDTGKAVLSE